MTSALWGPSPGGRSSVPTRSKPSDRNRNSSLDGGDEPAGSAGSVVVDTPGDRLVTMVVDTSGGTLAAGVVSELVPPHPTRVMETARTAPRAKRGRDTECRRTPRRSFGSIGHSRMTRSEDKVTTMSSENLEAPVLRRLPGVLLAVPGSWLPTSHGLSPLRSG